MLGNNSAGSGSGGEAGVHLFTFTEHCITVRLSIIQQREPKRMNGRALMRLFCFAFIWHMCVYVRENRPCQSLEFQQYGAVAIVDAPRLRANDE